MISDIAVFCAAGQLVILLGWFILLLNRLEIPGFIATFLMGLVTGMSIITLVLRGLQ